MERVIFILAFEKRWGCWMVHARRAEDKGNFFQATGRYLGSGEELPEAMRQAVEEAGLKEGDHVRAQGVPR